MATKTVEQLNALPLQSTVITADGKVWTKVAVAEEGNPAVWQSTNHGSAAILSSRALSNVELA